MYVTEKEYQKEKKKLYLKFGLCMLGVAIIFLLADFEKNTPWIGKYRIVEITALLTLWPALSGLSFVTLRVKD